MVALALYEPEIPQNTGSLLRLGACLGVPLHIIEPCGFPLSDARMRRAGMDYVERATLVRHKNWEHFHRDTGSHRLILLTPQASLSFLDISFQENDLLLLGKESTGFPQEKMRDVEVTVKIPMLPDRRSLNVAIAGAMVLTEALRQTHQFLPCSKDRSSDTP